MTLSNKQTKHDPIALWYDMFHNNYCSCFNEGGGTGVTTQAGLSAVTAGRLW